MGPLVPLPPSQEGAIVKHVLGQGVQDPVVPLAGVAWLPRHLDEAVIETQIVANGVLPPWKLFFVIRKSVLDKVTDATEGEPLVGGLEYAHTDHSDVGVGRLDHTCLLVLIRTILRNILTDLVMLLVPVPLCFITDVSRKMLTKCSRIKDDVVVSRFLLNGG